MRMYAEIISAEVDTRNITDKKSGKINPTQVFVIHAIDTDNPSAMFKISIWERFRYITREAMKGAIVEVIFRKIRPGNNYDPLDQITVSEDNIRVKKTAAEALKEMQAVIAKQAAENKRDTAPATTAPPNTL